MKLKDINFTLNEVIKIVGGAITVAGLWFSLNSRLDSIEGKLESIGKVSEHDKEKIYANLGRLNRKVDRLEDNYSEGKEKVNRELNSITDRIFKLYAILPKGVRIEDEAKTN